MTGYVALYCRISKDKRGRLEGVHAQEKWGRAFAETEWTGVPVVVFADNDISAADEDAHRPGYEALREAISRGEVAHLWAVAQARVSRSHGWFKFAAEMAAAGLGELHTRHDGIVRVMDIVADIKAVLNIGEVREMKKRLMDTLKEKADLGVPSGATPFGYVHGFNERGVKTLVIVKDQADIIRECAERVLAGWSQESIAADLRKRGMHGPHRVKVIDHQCTGRRRGYKKCGCPVRTIDGTPLDDGGIPVTRPSEIASTSVKSWLSNPTVAGHRVYQDQDMGLGTGNWPAILDETTWRAVRNKLDAPRTVQRTPGPEGREGPETYTVTPTTRETGRRYLLTSGTAVCGVCEAPMTASMKQFTRKLKDGTRKLLKVAPYYMCHPKTSGIKGHSVGIMGDEFEAYVVAELFAELEKPGFLEALAVDAHAARRDEIDAALSHVDSERIELAHLKALPRDDPNKLTLAEWQTMRSDLAARERQLRRELAEVPPPVDRADAATIRADWEYMTLDERRDVISTYINRVVVKRAKPGTQGFDKGRVTIEARPFA